MRYFIFSICLLFSTSLSAQSKKTLPVVVCEIGDTAKRHPTLSAVSFGNSDPAHVGEQVWFIMLNGKLLFNFKCKQQDDSKLDFAKSFGIKSVIITLDNDSLVLLDSNSRPQILGKDYLWVRSDVSIDVIKQFNSHKMAAITIVVDDNMQYPLFRFSKDQQKAIESASQCFLSNIEK